LPNSFTTLGFCKPEVGAATNVWGGLTNADWDLNDALWQRFVGTTTTHLLSFNVNGVSTTTTRSVIWQDTSGTVALSSDITSFRPPIRSYLAGLGTSNDVGTPNTKLDVAAGAVTDDTNAFMMTMAAGVITCTNTGVNGLDTGSLANSTWYHVFCIGTAGATTTAYVASTQPSSPTMPATYTLKRRIASFKTDASAHILPYTQIGDDFLWTTPIVDYNNTLGSGGAATPTLSTPLGIRCAAQINVEGNAGNAWSIQVVTPGQTGTVGYLLAGGVNQGACFASVITDTSSVVSVQTGATVGGTIVSIVTLGWTDRRGRDA
jgi:hypothetical protein